MLTPEQQAAYYRLRDQGVDPTEARRRVEALRAPSDATRVAPPDLSVAERLALPTVQEAVAGTWRRPTPPTAPPKPAATLGSMAKQAAGGVGDFAAQTVAAVPAATAILTGAGREALFPSSDAPIGQRIRQRVEQNPLMQGARKLTKLPSAVVGEPQNLPEKVVRIGGNLAAPFLAAGAVKAGKALAGALDDVAPALASEAGALAPGHGAAPVLGGMTGGLGGAAYGATQGDTPGERARNAVLYGLGGAAGGALLGMTAEKIGARYRALREQGLGPDEARGLLSESGAVGVKPTTAPAGSQPPPPPPLPPASPPTPNGPGGIDPEDYVGNLRRFQLDPLAEQRLREDALRIGPQLQGHPREVKRWVQTKAESMGLSGADVLETPGTHLDAAMMLAATDRYAENQRALTALYARKVAGGLSGEESALLHQNILAFEKENEALLARFITARTATGRSLNILKTFAGTNPDPMLWQAKAEMLHGKPLTDAVRAELAGYVAAGDRAKAIQLMAKLAATPPDELALSLWKAGLLTSPTTHLANVGGNTTMAALEAMKDAPAAATDWLLGMATGQRTKDFAPVRAAAAAARGARKGVAEARRIMAGIPLDDAIQKFDLGRRANFDNALLDAYVNGVFKSLQAEDRVFRGMALEVSLDEQARVLAKIAAKAGGHYETTYRQLLAAPTDEMAVTALEAAETATFQSRGALTHAVTGFKRSARAHGATGRAVAATVDVIAPFTNTPLNVALRVGEYAGGGYVAGTVNLARLAARVMAGAKPEEIRAVQRLASEQLGRAATGSLAIYLGYRLASQGKLTGTRSPKSSERDQQVLEGAQPASLRVGDEWHQLQRISPLGNLLVLGKTLYDLQHDPEAVGLGAQAGRYGAELVKGVSEQSFLKGVSGAMEALTNPQDRAGAFLRQTATSVVPTVVKRVAMGLDPVQRNVTTTTEAFQAAIPGQRQKLAPRVDQLGEPLPRTGGLGTALFDPTSPTTDRTRDPLIGALRERGVALTNLKRRANEAPEAFADRQEATGQLVRQELAKVLADPRFLALPIEQQGIELEKVARSVRALFTQKQKAEAYLHLRSQGVGAAAARRQVIEWYGGKP